MNKKEKPTIYVNFVGQEILGETGRLLFYILNVFAINGYPIRLFENVVFNELGKYGQLSYSIKNFKIIKKIPTNTENNIYLFDQEDNAWAKKNWKKIIQIKFDIFSNYIYTRYKKESPIMIPYPMHPLQYSTNLNEKLEKYRHNIKKMKLFFSGDMKGYKNNFIQYPKPKIPRLTVIETLLYKMSEQTLLIQDETELDNLYNNSYINQCVIIDTNKVWVDEKLWLDNISKTDFFLCPPGICMPMCHNVIEAMSVGAIPFINYPEWFNPDLKHLENCIVFDDEADLIDKINYVLNLDEQKILEMKAQVIDYYEKYLNPEMFIKKIEAAKQNKIILLMIIEKYVRNNALKLNAKSIVLGDDSALQNDIGYKMLKMFKIDQFLHLRK